MKRPNKHVTRLVSGTLATSILAVSCETDYTQPRVYQIYEAPGSLKVGENAISIDRTAEEQAYLMFLHELSWDIITEPSTAEAFVSNPEAFCARYGYNQPVNLDEGMLKMILALGDQEIHQAIMHNDIKTLITLLKNKNLVIPPSSVHVNLTQEQKVELLNLLGLSSEIGNSDSIVCAVVALVFFWVGVYCQAVAINQAIAAANLAVSIAVVTWIGAWSLHDRGQYRSFLEQNPFLRIYGLRTDQTNTYIAADMYMEQLVSDVADGLERDYPETFIEMSKDQFKQLMKINIMNNQ